MSVMIFRFQTMSVTASLNGTTNPSVDLTGTIIRSDKPVAIYYGRRILYLNICYDKCNM